MISQEKWFWTAEGKPIASLEELPAKIKEMPKEVFRRHVNDEKNDFASWVEAVFEAKELAKKLRSTKSKSLTSRFVTYYNRNKVLVVNSGSSSLKFKLFDMNNGEELMKGHFDRLGRKTNVRIVSPYERFEEEMAVKSHEKAVEICLERVKRIIDLKMIKAAAHRVVHGGEKYFKPAFVNKKVLKDLEEFSALAPLHNPPNIKGIKACMKALPKTKQIAVFDTSFHHSIPKEAFLYGIPMEFYEKHGIRKYGFHGSSHKYVSGKAGEILGGAPGKMIACHLGNGSSITAVKKGKSVDTTMGFTPLDGLIMGTRSGELDPEIIFYLLKNGHYTPKQLEEILNEKSGLLGLSGLSSDMRDIRKAALEGNERAKLTIEMLAYRIRKFIGSYIAVLKGVDCLVFTGGMGEEADYLRKMVCEELAGLELDEGRNERHETLISADDSKVKVLVVPTDEELQIARDAWELMS